MKSKSNKKIHSIITVILLVLIALFTYEIIGGRSKEVKAAETFMRKLEKIYAINLDDNVNDMDFEEVSTKGNIDNKVGFIVTTKNYGIDLDKKYRVVGFSKKEAKHGNKVNITDDEAIKIAEKFISGITDEQLEFKGIKEVEGKDLPYYNVTFSKKNGEYIYLDKDVVLQIDKYTGQLDGYSNYYLDDIEDISTIKVDEEKAIELVKNYLNKLGLELTDSNKVATGYVSINEKQNVLAYVYDIKYKSKEGEIHSYTIQVSSFNGDIINGLKDSTK